MNSSNNSNRVDTISERFERTLQRYAIPSKDFDSLLEDLLTDVISWQVDVQRQLDSAD